MTDIPQPGERYRHFKGEDKLYEVIGLEIDTDSNEGGLRVAYTNLYDSVRYPRGTRFSRSLEMFCDEVEVNGEIVKRFTKVE